MSVTMVALLFSDDSKNELISMGFKPRKVLVKYTTFPIDEKGIAQATKEVMSLGGITPLQFAATPFYENGEKVGVVQVAICLREDSEEKLRSFGFEDVEVLAKRGAGCATVEAIPKDEQEFLNMKFPPEKWYANSYWGAGE